MASDTSILERSVIQKGKIFIKAGEEISRAYVIQNGEAVAFTIDDGRRVEVSHFGPGAILGEMGLVNDEPSALSYEALTICTVVTVTRQEFQKRLARADKNIATIMGHAVDKVRFYENIETIKALKAATIDEKAYQLMNKLLQSVPNDRKMAYEDALLSPLNSLIKAIKELKRTDKQINDKAAAENEEAETLDEKLEENISHEIKEE